MRPRPRWQFRLSSWLWLTLVIAAFFLGRRWDATVATIWPKPAPPPHFLFGMGVTSEAGVTGVIVIDERNFDAAKP